MRIQLSSKHIIVIAFLASSAAAAYGWYIYKNKPAPAENESDINNKGEKKED